MGNTLVSARPASVEDARGMVSLDLQFGVEGSRDWTAVIENEDRPTDIVVAEERGICVGYVVVGRTADVAFPAELHVRPYGEPDAIKETLIATATGMMLEQGLAWVGRNPEPYPVELVRRLSA